MSPAASARPPHPGTVTGPARLWGPPPWLWLTLGLLATQLPVLFGGPAWTASWTLVEHRPTSDLLTALALTLVQVLPLLFLLAGALSLVPPRARTRWVEQRYGLGPPELPDTAPSPALDRRAPVEDSLPNVHDQMRRFLHEQAPGTELRVSGRRDLLARVYPGGRRTARIGVFSPLVHLWVQDREAAEAVLLHEVGHLRYGEQHVAGLGSPFTGLVRAWPYVFAVFGLLPVALLFASGNVAAPLMPAQIVLVVLSVVKVLLIVVGALWTAEPAADRHAAMTAGQRTHLRALNALDRRAEGLARLYHPPVGVRRWFASRTERLSAQLLLVLLWPATKPAGNLLDLFGAVTAYRLLGGSFRVEATRKAVSLAREQLIAGPVWWAMLATIALWPLIAGAWSRLWGWRGQPSDTFSRAAYAASALLPLLALAVGLLPVGPTAGGSSQQAGDQGPGVAATPPAGAAALPTPCPSRSRPSRPVRPEGVPSFPDARVSEDDGTARPTPDRTRSFRTLRVISVQPLSESLTQAQDVADRLAHRAATASRPLVIPVRRVCAHLHTDLVRPEDRRPSRHRSPARMSTCSHVFPGHLRPTPGISRTAMGDGKLRLSSDTHSRPEPIRSVTCVSAM